jgi:hypothetical protein
LQYSTRLESGSESVTSLSASSSKKNSVFDNDYNDS